MKPDSMAFDEGNLMLRPQSVELSSASLWPDFLVGQPDRPVRVLVVEALLHKSAIGQGIPNPK